MPIDSGGPTRLSDVCALDSEQRRDSLVVTLHGEFDLACEESFQREMMRLLDTHTAPLVVDLRGLTFMDSTGLRLLVLLNAVAVRDGLDLTIICNDEGPVGRLLRLTGVDQVLPVEGGSRH